MVLGDADMGGNPKNMGRGWKSELPRGQFGSEGSVATRGTKLPSGQFRFPSEAHIFFVHRDL